MILATDEFAQILRLLLQNSTRFCTCNSLEIAASLQASSPNLSFSDSSMKSSTRIAAQRLFGTDNVEMDDNLAFCCAVLLELGNDYDEILCRREILTSIQHFISAMNENYPYKKKIQTASKELKSRLIERFNKWLQTLMRKHKMDSDLEKITTEITEILFDLELDESSFLQKPINFVESLSQPMLTREIKNILIKLKIP